MEVHERYAEPWRVTLVDTGEDTLTAGRLKRVYKYVQDEEAFFFTYGDGVADIDMDRQLAFHREHGKLATLASVLAPGRYGALDIRGGAVTAFIEKPRGDGSRINGGFFILSPKVIDYIGGDATSWEVHSLVQIAGDGQLMAYRHDGFWQPMDTLRERTQLEQLWASNRAPWRRW
jgi:glucose-1-phosphate cytidylyltransferase